MTLLSHLDCRRARNAARLGIDPSRIAVMGDSAGGAHAASLTIAARDRRKFSLAYQCLIYPVLDDRTGSTRQMPPYMGHFVWTPQGNRFAWASLLGMPAESASPPPGSVPARVKDLSGLPPAFIGVGSIDLFCDEDIEYAIGSRLWLALDGPPGRYCWCLCDRELVLWVD